MSKKRREGFKEMIADVFAGKIDLIVTKSVSRFERNTMVEKVIVRRNGEITFVFYNGTKVRVEKLK